MMHAKMHTENQITIRGDARRVFALAADIGDWPRILPHYRWVTVFSDDGRVKQAEMAARRGRFPVKWRTAQVVLPDENRILFFHTGGVTRGMYVEWNLKQDGERVHVVISHALSYPLAPVTGWFARGVVGALFVHHIASLTLARVKQIVEAGDAPFSAVP
jgi:ribosome-associated toxin RatA of RatAB toxin-antitoxin module